VPSSHSPQRSGTNPTMRVLRLPANVGTGPSARCACAGRCRTRDPRTGR
jgi:hypothetical protein